MNKLDCPKAQADEIARYLKEGWVVDSKDQSDDQVLIHKGFSFRWVRPNGTSYAA